MSDLEAQLIEANKQNNRYKIIVTDGVFSMDGIVAQLDKICDLANKYEEMGFSKLHIVDLDGSRKGFSNNSSVITEIIKSSGLIVQLG